MDRIKITVIPGDGIGPDIVEVALQVLDRLDVGLDYEMAVAGQTALDQGLDLIPEQTLAALAATGAENFAQLGMCACSTYEPISPPAPLEVLSRGQTKFAS